MGIEAYQWLIMGEQMGNCRCLENVDRVLIEAMLLGMTFELHGSGRIVRVGLQGRGF